VTEGPSPSLAEGGREGKTTTASRLSLNAIALIVAYLLPPLVGFFIVAYVGRRLGAVALGEYNVAYTWYYLLVPVANLGLQGLLVRRLARPGASLGAFVARALMLVFVSGTACGLVMWAGGRIAGHSATTQQAILLLAVTMGLTSAVPVLHGVFISQERNWIVLLCEGVESLFRLAISLVLIWLGYGVVWLIGAFVVSRLISLGLCLAFIRHKKPLGGSSSEGSLSLVGLLRQALPFAAIAWLNMAYWRIGLITLATIRGEEAVGIFTAANKLSQNLQLVPESLMLTLFPRLSHGFARDRGSFERLTELSVRYLLATTLLIVLLLVLTAGPVLRFIYERQVFQQARPVLYVLAVALLPYAAFRLLLRLLMAGDQERMLAAWIAAGTALSVVLNGVLVYYGSALGLALSTALTLTGLSGALAWAAARQGLISARAFDVRRLALLALTAVLAGGTGYLLRGFGWLATTIGSTIVYGGLLLLFRIVSPDEMGLLRPSRPGRGGERGAEQLPPGVADGDG